MDDGPKFIQAKEEYQRRLTEVRRDIQIGLDQIKRGEVMDGKVVFKRIRERLRRWILAKG